MGLQGAGLPAVFAVKIPNAADAMLMNAMMLPGVRTETVQLKRESRAVMSVRKTAPEGFLEKLSRRRSLFL